MIDLSDKDLAWLSEIVRLIHEASGDRPFLIAGATARDLLVTHARGLKTGRATMDVDFALLVESWDEYRQLRERLLATGQFAAVRGIQHRLMHGRLPVDLVPFGGVETAECKIIWPGDETEMSTVGFKEALEHSETVRLPTDVDVHVAALPSQALLKLVIWAERPRNRGSKDAQDLRTLMKAYGEIERDRLLEDAEVVQRPDFDVDAAGARLLGLDAGHAATTGALTQSPLLPTIQQVLYRETDREGSLTLVSSMGGAVDENLRNVIWFREGLESGMKSKK